ncbi:dienelactone hydrolase family protein [Micromonospora sp. R77]|uniref:dienelactone hydrolase family protein n=1 Tax=Micromonospora sp. R77 TaxID=2925836 RepID=UPI001F617A8C|nr:dienelactone hydrolase family protein [Micromonospora sp. R77]MCI4066485.1 dienelactone hydrolase family protein [Micromonospora sp. R77]
MSDECLPFTPLARQAADATIATRTLHYRDRDTPLTGIVYRDGTRPDAGPGVLLIHGGAGLDAHARDQARRYAELGYTVLACDMYGDGVAADRQRIMECVTSLRDDPELLVRRGRAGLRALSECPEVTGPIAAIGFCFGGMAALALARSGTDIAGVVSIHGTLTTSMPPAAPGTVRARILVCHGASDPHVPMDSVVAFTDEMNRAGADWQVIIYGRAMHGFTHRDTVPGASGVAYDPAADERSFDAVRTFLAGALAAR